MRAPLAAFIGLLALVRPSRALLRSDAIATVSNTLVQNPCLRTGLWVAIASGGVAWVTFGAWTGESSLDSRFLRFAEQRFQKRWEMGDDAQNAFPARHVSVA